VNRGLTPGSVWDINLREGRLLTEIAYGFQEVVSPGRDVIFSFYIPEKTTKIQFLKINIYFPGFQQGDYPLNSNIIYLPYAMKGTPVYQNGDFLSFNGSVQPEVGNIAGGTYYRWARLFTKFLVSSIRGFKLSSCKLKWLLSFKSEVGSGSNTQIPLCLHAIADYGVMGRDDWETATVIDYGGVNFHDDTEGLVYSKNVMARIQALIDSAENYAAFRFKATTENTDKDNSNTYHLDEPVLYCEIEEDSSAKVGIYANDGKGFGDMLVSFNQNQEDIELQRYFSGVGKKQIKLSASRSRRVEVLVRMAIKLRG
jgi:hypothetical protein